MRLRGREVGVTASIGIALAPGDGDSPELLFTAAETAMFEARRAGGDRIQFAAPERTRAAREHLELLEQIRAGIARDEFVPYFQPIVDARARRVVGCEALLRWQHPQRGLLAPDAFIEAAEDAGLIHALGEACLRQCAGQLARWRQAGLDLTVSVNLSARQLEDGPLIAVLERMAGMALELEITETAMLSRPDAASAVCHQIRELGFGLSVDDFGTGYSSLSYVQHLPLSRVKVDRSFVSRLPDSQPTRAIVSAIVALAAQLQCSVVAEGVEQTRQRDALLALGCHLQQGWLYARPMPAGQLADWVRRFEAGEAGT